MLSFRPDMGRLMRLASRERLLPPGDDPGYAVHAVFTASFGELAPKPFALLLPGAAGGGPAGRLLAYSAHSLAALRSQAAAFADPAFSAALDLDAAEDKAMPERFAAGMRLGFRVRVRPVRRTGKPRPAEGLATGKGGGREHDLYDGPAEDETPVETRARLYLDWLALRLGETCGARLETAALESFRLTRLLTRDRSGPGQTSRTVNGPDATIAGTLVVADSDAFAAGLARGIGRHRAFGFGMLLLAPAKR
jgi:CRISPR system Cascade subunit CasE